MTTLELAKDFTNILRTGDHEGAAAKSKFRLHRKLRGDGWTNGGVPGQRGRQGKG